MRQLALVAFVSTLASGWTAHADAPPPKTPPDEVLARLTAGNRAFVANGASCTRQSPGRRSAVASAQHPVAVIVGCSDSRVPPEALFDQGIGDLFVVRVAGNVVDDAVLGSIEYAVEHLGATLVVVLGHERCGAVTAALENKPAPGHIEALVERIRPAIAQAHGRGGDPLENAVRANVAAQAKTVRTAQPTLAPLVGKGQVKVVGARYDLDSGVVEWLP